MSANKEDSRETALWLRSPDNARISFLLVLIVVLLKLPLGGSLWLDEGVTAWVTSADLFTTLARATQFQGQSPLYFILEWGMQILLGPTEFALRLLSLSAMAGATAIFILLARRFGGAAYGWVAGTVFIAIDSVQVVAVSARPYGLALFFSLVSVWALLLWEERGKYRYSLLYLFSFLLSVYFQYLFAAMFAVHAVHVLLNFRSQRVKFISFIFEFLLVVALVFPAFLHMVDMSGKGALWQFVPRPTALALFRALFPPVLLVSAVGAIVVGVLIGKCREYSLSVEKRQGIWIGFWYLFPPLLMFVASLAGPSSLFLDRYFLFYTPALALLFAVAPFILKNGAPRAIALATFVAFLLLHEGDRAWKIEDWRGAAAIARSNDPDTIVLVYSGLAESKEISWLRDKEKRQYLLAPLLYYKLANPVALLPRPDERPEVTEYFDSTAKDIPAGSKRVLFIGLEQKFHGKSTVDTWVERIKEKGFSSKEIPLGTGSTVRVVQFDRV